MHFRTLLHHQSKSGDARRTQKPRILFLAFSDLESVTGKVRIVYNSELHAADVARTAMLRMKQEWHRQDHKKHADPAGNRGSMKFPTVRVFRPLDGRRTSKWLRRIKEVVTINEKSIHQITFGEGR